MLKKVSNFFFALLLFIPISFVCAFVLKDPTLTFVTSVLAIIPLARLMGYATREIVLQTNPMASGVISATFGNAIEVIIALLALNRGLIDLVEASIIGSIIGNILLLIGLSIFFGGLKHKEQHFNNKSVGVSSTMLIIAVTGLAIPTAFALTSHPNQGQIYAVSATVAIVLALIYIAGLVFAFITHKQQFDASDEMKAARDKPSMSMRRAILILFGIIILVGIESTLLVDGVRVAAQNIGLTEAFVGVVVIAIVTNIAEQAIAVRFARQNKIDVAIEIGLSSAIQIALFVVPILVIASQFLSHQLTLIFSVFEIISMFLAVMIVNYLSADGKCNWLEGAQLVAVYAIIVAAFYFI